MESKPFEVRDRATNISVLATRLEPQNEDAQYVLARAGYGESVESQSSYVLLSKLCGDDVFTTFDSREWDSRTMTTAHNYIKDHWDELSPGQVVDVEFILGESESPKVSDRFYVHQY